jgi:ribosome small subunit-dependent GTPase A
VVGSAAEPPFKPRLVDRYLISFRLGGLSPALILNKIDLAEPHEVDEWLATYRSLGVEAVGVSAATGAGIPELEAMLHGRTAVFAGQSGVGKSSLLNRLAGLDLRTADVYGKLGKGRHTTTTSALYRLPSGGEVVDTPGVPFAVLRHARGGARVLPIEGGGGWFGTAATRGTKAARWPLRCAGGDPGDRLDSFLALREEAKDSKSR